MTGIGLLLGLFTVVGAIVCILATLGFAYYLATRRPTPNATVREAVGSLDWGYGFALFIAPGALVGVGEFGGIEGALHGSVIGVGFLGYMVVLQWWWGPI